MQVVVYTDDGLPDVLSLRMLKGRCRSTMKFWWKYTLCL